MPVSSQEGGGRKCVLAPAGNVMTWLLSTVALVLRGTNLHIINLIAANSTGTLLPKTVALWDSARRALLPCASASPVMWDPASLSVN